MALEGSPLGLGIGALSANVERYFWKMRRFDSSKGKLRFVPAVPGTVSSPKMNLDGMTSSGSDDSDQVDPWIHAQLSTDQVRWLQRQAGVMNQPDLLKSALAEWVIRHPEDWFRGTRLSDAIRAALSEFIDRHKDEFLVLE
jgi:hypothetical protein